MEGWKSSYAHCGEPPPCRQGLVVRCMTRDGQGVCRRRSPGSPLWSASLRRLARLQPQERREDRLLLLVLDAREELRPQHPDRHLLIEGKPGVHDPAVEVTGTAP